MCIVYRTAAAEQGFGRRVPLALAPMLAAEADRGPLRRAARDVDWGAFLPSRAERRVAIHGALDRLVMSGDTGPPPPVTVAPLWGGPPAIVDARGVARLAHPMVDAIARELETHDEAWLRAAYAREREHVGGVLPENDVVECHALLRRFFTAATGDVSISWEYR
jgi:hypothetical protein